MAIPKKAAPPKNKTPVPKSDSSTTQKKLKAVTEEQLQEMLATVTKRHRILKKKLAKTGNPRVQDVITLEYMLKQSIEMLELSNSGFITSNGRGLYGVIALNTNIKELMAEKRALEDNSDQIEHIIENILSPMLTIISQQNLNFSVSLKDFIHQKINGSKATAVIDKMNDLLKGQAMLYDDCMANAKAQLEEFMNG